RGTGGLACEVKPKSSAAQQAPARPAAAHRGRAAQRQRTASARSGPRPVVFPANCDASAKTTAWEAYGVLAKYASSPLPQTLLKQVVPRISVQYATTWLGVVAIPL